MWWLVLSRLLSRVEAAGERGGDGVAARGKGEEGLGLVGGGALVVAL